MLAMIKDTMLPDLSEANAALMVTQQTRQSALIHIEATGQAYLSHWNGQATFWHGQALRSGYFEATWDPATQGPRLKPLCKADYECRLFTRMAA
ncbi:hypothetical protein [Ferrimonas marina]|uniref:hypothetical protein n=1 Tax=Ferrimonas marina TaxID=299255 RepID=UPI0011613985|nr:hypothetical protein [Ferrimonas marina]